MTFLLENLLLIGLALVSGGLLLWPLIRGNGGGKALSPLEATQLINHDNAIVVDVRDDKDFAAGSLTGARNVPLAKLAEGVGDLVRFKARPVVIVCAAGQQSTKAVARFNALGFERAYALAGGVAAWKQAGLPLVQPGRDTSRVGPKDASRKARPENRGSDRSKRGRGNGPAVAPPTVAGAGSAVIGAAVVADQPVPVVAVEPVSSAAAVAIHAPEPVAASAVVPDAVHAVGDAAPVVTGADARAVGADVRPGMDAGPHAEPHAEPHADPRPDAPLVKEPS